MSLCRNKQSHAFFGCVALLRTFLLRKFNGKDDRQMEKTYLQEVGERLFSLRSHGFMSRKELAKRTEIPVQTIAKMEQGKRAIDISDVTKICRALGCSTDYLLTGGCGFIEFLRLNQKIFGLPEISLTNMETVARAFWNTRPNTYR